VCLDHRYPMVQHSKAVGYGLLILQVSLFCDALLIFTLPNTSKNFQ